MTIRYRSRAGIIYDVLRTLKDYGPLPATRVMYGANLPYDRLRSILEMLKSKGYVEEVKEGDKVLYKLTRKGFEALNYLEKVKRMFDELGLKF